MVIVPFCVGMYHLVPKDIKKLIQHELDRPEIDLTKIVMKIAKAMINKSNV